MEKNEKPKPLAQEFTIAARQITKDHYMHDPGMTCMPDGTIFVAAGCREWEHKRVLRNTPDKRNIIHSQILLARSFDNGETWEALNPIMGAGEDATPFVHKSKLYLLLPDYESEELKLICSDDKGETWSKSVTLLQGDYEAIWNCSTSMAVKDDKLYWAFGHVSVIAADLTKDLMCPETWRVSNTVNLPNIPETLRSDLYPPDSKIWPVQWPSDRWLEPNMVNVNGYLRVLVRIIIDEYATANICGICDLDDDGGEMKLKFTQFAALPGAQTKFFILYDDVSKLFWMLSNTPTDSQGFFADRGQLLSIGYHGGPGNERRILMLHYSIDAMNWFSAGCAAMWPSPIQSFMYPSAAIHGDDILFISRTSEFAQNQHDADIVTFHKIKNFRSLAMDIFPKYPDGPSI